MRLCLTFGALVLFLSHQDAAGQEQSVPWRSTAKTAVFIELFGNGGLLTYNLDRKLNQRVTARFGYGHFNSIELGDGETKQYQTFTGMVNALGDAPGWSTEMGVGLMMGTYRGEGWIIPRKPLLHITSVLGLRRQPADGGLVIRIGATPRYVLKGDDGGRGLSLGLGVSAGLSF
jgi:hypothetical protein